MIVRQKNPKLEARQLTIDNVEEVAEWCGLNRTHILWHRNEAGEGEPSLIYGDRGVYAHLGDWIVKKAERPSRFTTVTDGYFQREYLGEPEDVESVDVASDEPIRHTSKDIPTDFSVGPMTVEKIEAIDRNARAYGYEVGKGANLAQVIHTLSDDNPFLDKDWRLKMMMGENDAG